MRSRDIGGNIMAGLHALGDGGVLDERREELAAARQDALAHLAALAAERGANAVVGVRFHNAEVGHDMREIVAYGTAVVLERGTSSDGAGPDAFVMERSREGEYGRRTRDSSAAARSPS